MIEGIYLYCFAENAVVHNLDGGVFSLEFAEIAAICRRIEIADFTNEENLQNPEWLIPRVLEHEKIIEKVNENSAVFPAAFGSIFSDTATLLDLTGRNFAAIADFLSATRGLREFSVKGFLSRETAQNAILKSDLAAEINALADLSEGKRFFAEKKLHEAAAQTVNQRTGEICESIAAEFEAFARDSRERKIVANPEEIREAIFNWALLLDADGTAKLDAATEKFNQQHLDSGLQIEIAGAFPPFSFVPQLKDAGE